jgi:hypothetical protein
MNIGFNKNPLALAVIAAIGTATLVIAPITASATSKTAGQYVSGDFHNHTTCSDGSISMEKLVKKATDKTDTPWGLDWFVQAGHGNSGGTRNCTLIEDATLATPAYPYVAGEDPNTTWTQSIGSNNVKGDTTSGVGYMWRWQSVQEYQYGLVEYLNAYLNKPLFIGLESIVAGHEHASMSVITGQIPAALDTAVLPNSPGYTPLGNANALSQWNYCFDLGDTDKSRGDQTGTTFGNNWDCSVSGSLNSQDPSWNTTAEKLIPAGTTNVGIKGHAKTVEGLKWMAANHPNGSYYVPAHLERAGQFNPNGNNGYNIEHLRDFNNAAPNVAFGMESQPGHGASANRGEYQVLRNGMNVSSIDASGNINFGNGVSGTTKKIDSVGGTTFGGTGVYAGVVGGVWDALLGEGRNFWFFASSDWHNRGNFGADDRRSTQDFYPGEYQRNYTLVRNGADKIRPQTIVDGLRTGNVFATGGQLIDRLAFIACASYPGPATRSNAAVEALAVAAATHDTDIDTSGCATLGEKLVVRPGAEIVVSVVVRDPAGTNYSPYSFNNPSLKQVGISQPLNTPVLDHIDLIGGLVTGYKTPGAADYSGAWPANTGWLHTDGTTTGLTNVPDGAKNTSAAILKTFSGSTASWTPVVSGVDGTQFLKMSYRIPAVSKSQYVRLRGSNLPASVPYETDANGNPLTDLFTNQNDTTKLSIPCTTPATNEPTAGGVAFAGTTINGCPSHLATATGSSPIAGQKAVSFDIAAWSDLWFYANPIYIQVNGSYTVAGVK